MPSEKGGIEGWREERKEEKDKGCRKQTGAAVKTVPHHNNRVVRSASVVTMTVLRKGQEMDYHMT